MKKKKGKKSLGDLGNFRSARLKELSKNLLPSSIGTNSTSIQTTSSSDLPPSKYISGTNSDYSSLILCEQLGKYEEYCYNPKTTYFLLDRFFVNLDVQDNYGQGNQKGVGWRLNTIPKDWSNIVPGAPPYGYLFVYFHNSFERSNCTTGNAGQLPDKLTGGVCSNVESGKPNSRNYFQGAIFAVVISKISQINALNRTLGNDSNGSFLSSKINDTKDINYTMILDRTDFYVRKFINDIRSRNNNDITPILPYDPVNPLSLFSDNVFKFYGGEKNKIYNIKERLLIQETFISSIPSSNIRKFLPMSHVQKLSFTVLNLLTFDYDDWNKPLSGIAELVNNNTSIKFLDSGFFVITYVIGPCDDYENIYENPKGPSFYGPKVFTMRFKALIR
jgi:hypothetical protein